MLAFRDHCWHTARSRRPISISCARGLKVPHLFINQLVHVILRNALDDCDDPYVLRAGELFFRPQRMTLHEGSLIAGDEETIAGKSDKPVSPLVSMLGIPAEAEVDVMNDDNADALFRAQRPVPRRARSHRRPARPSGAGTAIARWIEHLLDIEVDIEPFTEVRDATLTWYVGLDADGTRIGDALWNGEELTRRCAQRCRPLSVDVPRPTWSWTN